MSATIKKRKRDSRRSSTFVPGRIKSYHSQEEAALGGKLYEAIDIERPDDERLCMLTKSCLQFTLQKLEEEMTDVEDFLLIRKEIEDAVLRKIADMEEKGKFKDLTQKKRYLPNPINLEMDEAEKEISFHINRYNKEVENWEDDIQDMERKATDFKNKEKVIPESEIPAAVKSLASEYMCGTYDYNAIPQDVDNRIKAKQIQIYSHANDVRQLKQGYDAITEILHYQIPRFKTEAFQDLDCQSPRRLIMKMAEHCK